MVLVDTYFVAVVHTHLQMDIAVDNRLDTVEDKWDSLAVVGQVVDNQAVVGQAVDNQAVVDRVVDIHSLVEDLKIKNQSMVRIFSHRNDSFQRSTYKILKFTYGLVRFLDTVVDYHAYKLGLDLDCLERPQLATIRNSQALVCMLVVELDANHLGSMHIKK